MEPKTEPRRRRKPQQIVIEPEPEPIIPEQPMKFHTPPTPIPVQTHEPEEPPIQKRKPQKKQKRKKKIIAKRSLCQFLSAAILIAYTIFLVQYFFGVSVEVSEEATTMNLGGSIATALVTPHMLFCTLASIFSAIAFLANNRPFSLVAAILECVAAVMFVMYAPFLIPSIVLGFIGYARIGSLKKRAAEYKED